MGVLFYGLFSGVMLGWECRRAGVAVREAFILRTLYMVCPVRSRHYR